MKAVLAEQLKKSYRSGGKTVQALQNISFEVEQGELFGVIGPDGAGKTSLFRILTTLLLADEGSAHIDGFDVVQEFREIRKRVGYMPGRFSLYQDLSVSENLEFFATIFNTSIGQNYDLIRDIYEQIEPFKDRKAGKLSGGMKQKLALCCALIHKPSILFLDEPTTGVDAVSRKEFWEMLKKLKEQQITILVSTPYMDEASLCDRVALIQNGKFLSIDAPENIIDSFGKPLLAVRSDRMFQLQQEIKGFEGVLDCYPFGEYHHVVIQPGKQQEVKNEISSIQHRNLEVRGAKPNIEDCFMALMKE